MSELLNTEASTTYDKASITGWERGEYAPPVEVVHALEVVLEAEGQLAKILGYRDGRRPTQLAALSGKLDKLSEKDRRYVEDLVDRLLDEDPPG